jgi:hypothetical protein
VGPYCRYCDRRCFVARVLVTGQAVLLATCEAGKAHDRKQVGQDATTAVNPVTDPAAAAALAPVPGHGCTIVESPKMDAPGLVAAVCECGEYRSSPGNENRVRVAHRHHAQAKAAKEARAAAVPAE